MRARSGPNAVPPLPRISDSKTSGAAGDQAGINIIAETRDERLWAIQAKAYHPDYSIKKSDVDSFLSESARPEFSYRPPDRYHR